MLNRSLNHWIIRVYCVHNYFNSLGKFPDACPAPKPEVIAAKLNILRIAELGPPTVRI